VSRFEIFGGVRRIVSCFISQEELPSKPVRLSMKQPRSQVLKHRGIYHIAP
jgi:hypothetical protein